MTPIEQAEVLWNDFLGSLNPGTQITRDDVMNLVDSILGKNPSKEIVLTVSHIFVKFSEHY